MNDRKSYTKYQVYFFLYLAVICELLIIIVERDEAEASLLSEKQRIESILRTVVRELMNTTPVAVTRGVSQMMVGEQRLFTFTVEGLGVNDDVSKQPFILVTRNGGTVDSIALGDGLENLSVSTSTADGASDKMIRTYGFTWKAPAVGTYEFVGHVGTDRIAITENGSVKLGGLELPLSTVRGIIGDDQVLVSVIDSLENLTTSMFVDVVSRPDKVSVFGSDVVTATGFPAVVPVDVQGVDANSVRLTPSTGRAYIQQGQWYWSGVFTEPGSKTVSITAGASRGEGARDRAADDFTITVKDPVPLRPIPAALFEKETFRMHTAVAGLEDHSRYAWRITVDGVEAASGQGADIAWKPSSRGRVVVTSTYNGMTYPVTGHSGGSTFSYDVAPLPVRIDKGTLPNDLEVSITHTFIFHAARFGRYRNEYSEPVKPNEVRVEVEDENGRDLYKDHVVTQQGTRSEISVVLRGRVPRDGVDATLVLWVDKERITVPFRVYPE